MIYFVGAGSGAPDLITVRGKTLLEQADLVIYTGSLVNTALLGNCKAEAEIYDSAKMHLEEIIEKLSEAEKAGKMSVRLHTGDHSLYGSTREQMEELDKLGYEYELCPGVSSFVAAASALQVEYTVPSVSQSLIITRMEGKTPVPEKEKLASLARHQTSMVIFLSAGLSAEVQAELLAGGYPEDTPCAIAYRVSWPDEQLIHCELKDLHQTLLDRGIRNFALIMVGDFLGEKYQNSLLYAKTFTTAFREGE